MISPYPLVPQGWGEGGGVVDPLPLRNASFFSQNKKNAQDAPKQKNIQKYFVNFLQGSFKNFSFFNIFSQYFCFRTNVFFFQNHQFQAFLVSKKYIFVHVKKHRALADAFAQNASFFFMCSHGLRTCVIISNVTTVHKIFTLIKKITDITTLQTQKTSNSYNYIRTIFQLVLNLHWEQQLGDMGGGGGE